MVEIGKLPPQAVDLEIAVLGAIMLEKNAILQVMDILTPESFYDRSHIKIYNTCIKLYHNSRPIDILTVTQGLKELGDLDDIGGAIYIAELTKEVASAANIQYHARIVQQKFLAREIIRLSSINIAKAYDDTTDILELLDQCTMELIALGSTGMGVGEKYSTEIFNEATDYIFEVKRNREEGIRPGIPTYINAIDKVTGGWQNSDLIIIAARPGMGKTAFTKKCIQGAVHAKKKPVLMFSLEMSTRQLATRMISEEVEIPTNSLLSGDFGDIEKEILGASSQYFGENNEDLLIINDTPALSANEIRSISQRLKSEKDICMVMVDYLQLVGRNRNSKASNREREIAEISGIMKQIAKELDLPVIALSQLNRAVEQRADRRPGLADLRESGAIENDADMVAFLYRPYYYFLQGLKDFETINKNDVTYDSKGYAEFIIAKNRNGSIDTIPMQFIDHLTKFDNFDEAPIFTD